MKASRSEVWLAKSMTRRLTSGWLTMELGLQSPLLVIFLVRELIGDLTFGQDN